MKILLTGAQGNFGREFTRQTNFEVVTLTRSGWEDLDKICGQGIDVIVHAASDLHTQVAQSPVSVMDSNLVSTTRLLEAAREHRIPRFVFMSSCAVYGEDMRTHEDNHCFPVSVNGICKLLNEKLIAEFCSAHAIKYEIFRVFNMYGGNDHFSIINRLEKAWQTGTPFRLNNQGIAQRDFIHVSDVVSVILQLLPQQIPYSELNIGTGVATKISTLVGLVAQRFPDFPVQHASVEEAEYSRADITRLRNLIDQDFLSVEDYLRNRLAQTRDGATGRKQ